jgi:hypothetical protein
MWMGFIWLRIGYSVVIVSIIDFDVSSNHYAVNML